MKIYELSLYSDKHGNALREYDLPSEIVQIWRDAFRKKRIWLNGLFIYKYLKANKAKLPVMELTCEERKKERIDVEYTTALDSWCVSQKFKDFVEKERIPLDFYKAMAKGEEWRYIAMRGGLGKIEDYEMDEKKSKYDKDGDLSSIWYRTFRSDIIEYYGYKMFTSSTGVYVFVTDKLKKKFDEQGFKLRYREMSVTEIPLDRKKVEKELVEIKKKTEKRRKETNHYGEMKKVDDYLVEVLQEEWWKEEEIERLRESGLIGQY